MPAFILHAGTRVLFQVTSGHRVEEPCEVISLHISGRCKATVAVAEVHPDYHGSGLLQGGYYAGRIQQIAGQHNRTAFPTAWLWLLGAALKSHGRLEARPPFQA